MRIQHDMEYAFVYKHNGSPDAVAKVRQDPEEYLDSLLEKVRLLAGNLLHIQQCESDIKRLENLSMATQLTEEPVYDIPEGENPIHRNSNLSGDDQRSSVVSTGSRNSTGARTSNPNPSPSNPPPLRRRMSQMATKVSNQQTEIFVARMNKVKSTPRGGSMAFEKWADLGRAHTSSSHTAKARSVRPTWPKWLSDTTFDVVRFSRYGKRLPRQLLLTEYHMMALRGDEAEIRTATKFTDIADLRIIKDHLLVTTGDRTYKYESPKVAHICHQIKSRINARRALERSGFYYSGLSALSIRGHNANEAARLVSGLRESLDFTHGTGSSQVDVVHLRDLVDFAEHLHAIAMRKIDPDMPLIEPKTWCDEDTLRLQTVVSGSKEAMVKEAVQSVLSDASAAEGYTRRRFIDHFQALPPDSEERTPRALRDFIENMFEYMVEKRWPEFMRLAGVSQTEEKVDEEKKETEGQGITSVNKEHTTGAVVAFLLYMAVEESVFVPLEEVLYPSTGGQDLRSASIISQSHVTGPNAGFASFDRNAPEGQTPQNLQDKIRWLRVKRSSQEAWEIPTEFRSDQGFNQAILTLAGVEGSASPLLRLHSLVEAVKLIFIEFEEHKKITKSSAILGADDLLPIFIYVFVFAELRYPDIIADCLWNVCHPDQLLGESGYFLTILESTVCYLQDLAVEE